jgi:hypothetical protein
VGLESAELVIGHSRLLQLLLQLKSSYLVLSRKLTVTPVTSLLTLGNLRPELHYAEIHLHQYLGQH